MNKINQDQDQDQDTLQFFLALPSKSSQIRFLDSIGMTRGAITKYMNKNCNYREEDQIILYQHVRNVLITPIKG